MFVLTKKHEKHDIINAIKTFILLFDGVFALSAGEGFIHSYVSGYVHVCTYGVCTCYI